MRVVAPSSIGAMPGGSSARRTIFPLSVSFGRPVHPISKTNWEGVGVAPTVEAAPEQAFDVAYALALARLAQTKGAAPAVRADYVWRGPPPRPASGRPWCRLTG